MSLGKQILAELVGTFALIYVGGGSIMAFELTGSSPSLNAGALVGVAFAHGLAIGVMVTATAHISGGHLNPAVTLGLFAGGRVRLTQAIVYIIAQLVGATLGALFLYLSFPPSLVSVRVSVPALNPDISNGQGILIEAVLTFFLVFVVAGTAVDERTPARIGGLAIGLTVTLDILMGGRLTGAAMNPARYMGPALVATSLDQFYVYWIGPVLGGVLAGIVYSYGLMQPSPTTRDLGHDHSTIEKER